MPLEVSHFTYATALDLVMGYCNIKLSVDASKLCICTQYSLTYYNHDPTVEV